MASTLHKEARAPENRQCSVKKGWRPARPEEVRQWRQEWESFRSRQFHLTMAVGFVVGLLWSGTVPLWTMGGPIVAVIGIVGTLLVTLIASSFILEAIDRFRPAECVGRVDSGYYYAMCGLAPFFTMLIWIMVNLV